jgi:hypothetical protein
MIGKRKISSGVFVPSSGWWYEEFLGDVGNGSFNQVVIGLGYASGQVQAINLFEGTNGIYSIGILPLTMEPLFILTEASITKLRTSQVDRQLGKIDWSWEHDAIKVDEILDEAIDTESWSVPFMHRIFPDLAPDDDQVFQSERLGYYLFVQDGKLVDYGTADGLTKWAKHLNELNPHMVNCWLGEGLILHGESEKAIEYVNLQAEAWAGLSGSMDNPHIPEYSRKDGSIDFFMIRVNEDRLSASLSDFKLRIGKLSNTGVVANGQLKYTFDGRTYGFVGNVLYSIE